MVSPARVALFKDTYQRLTAQSLDSLHDLYSAEVVFEDPFHRVEGLAALRRYFEALYREVRSCTFAFEREWVDGDHVMLLWTMSLQHPRLNGGLLIRVPGTTHLRFDEKVVYHRDYFDGGAVLYEHVPLIGFLVRAVKRRMS